MRKSLLIASILLAATLAAGSALLRISGLPWRGARARALYADVLRGRLPMLQCQRVPAVGPSTSPSLLCSGISADSTHGLLLEARDGRVHAFRQLWWRDSDAGPAFADSLARVLTDARGAAIDCRLNSLTAERGRDERRTRWEDPRRAGAMSELHARSGVPWSDGGARGWVVTLEELHPGAAACGPA